ncbi:MAG: hypothetical protein QOK00_835 [Thermoleophilaceae bacterium]|jgi:hypothetical protein|nr:hypothetical protein [Thermoleophilaceae bacterium]
MEYAAHLPRVRSPRSMVGPLVALLVGAGAATGAYALIDDGSVTTAPSQVIVVEKPGPHAAEIPGKNESATAAAISPSHAAQIARPDESATAAAISQSSGVDLRGSKASATGTSSQDAASANRTDPHGPANQLHNRWAHPPVH